MLALIYELKWLLLAALIIGFVGGAVMRRLPRAQKTYKR